jgi:hypothetical protein
MTRLLRLSFLSGLATCLLAFAATAVTAEEHKKPRAAGAEISKDQVQVPKPPFSEGIFPCSQCHDPKAMAPNTKRRVLKDMHTEISLNHGPDTRWCLDCHDAYNRDSLHLANGKLVSFNTSYQLCGQCHGDKLRDWRVGIHGKRTGSWNGAKQYLLCVHCHNPHSPHFKSLKPMPPPTRPEAIQLKNGGAR